MPEPIDDAASRSVDIDCSVARAVEILGDVETLPLWASFYRARLGRVGDRLRFETALGESLTGVAVARQAGGAQVTIRSAFAERVETALVQVDEIGGDDGQRVRVAFHIRFPAHVPQPRRSAMLQKIEGELLGLKRMLERDGAEHPAGNRADPRTQRAEILS